MTSKLPKLLTVSFAINCMLEKFGWDITLIISFLTIYNIQSIFTDHPISRRNPESTHLRGALAYLIARLLSQLGRSVMAAYLYRLPIPRVNGI